MSNSPNMSSIRTVPVSINKCSSNENVCKTKEDRVRSNCQKFKQRNDNGNNSRQNNGNCSRQNNNGRGQFNNYKKQPRSRNAAVSKRAELTQEPGIRVGKNRISLNHLLNFTLDPYQSHEVFPTPRRGNRTVTFNKEQYIQANCQFIMKEGEDYSLHLSDADLIMDWDNVEKVNMWNDVVSTCPICLCEPYATRITKCGHMYCWPCILHYLSLSEKTWRKCPICHEAVQKSDLKSVTVHKEVNHKVQNVITMKLMKRYQGTNVSINLHDENHMNGMKYKFKGNESSQEQRNMKYLVATPRQVLEDIINAEKQQLEFKLATESDDFERTFIQLALDLCKLREVDLLESLGQSKDAVTSCQENECDEVNDAASSKEVKDCGRKREKKSNDDIIGGEATSLNAQAYYFYQASDRQHIYLSSLDVGCLLQEYGTFDKCPEEFTAKILESDGFTMNEALRKRRRFLSHLPLSLEFRIVELDLRPPLVSMETLGMFREAIDDRSARRKKKSRDEKRILRKSQNEALRRQGRYPAARICLENKKQFPQMPQQKSFGSFSVLIPSPENTPGNEEFVASSYNPPLDDAVVTSSETNTPSFAQMLKSPKSDAPPTWPRHASSHATTSTNEDHDFDDDDELGPPTYQSSFGDALTSALDHMALPSGHKSKKGKKSKKVLLFTTSSHQHQ